MPLLCGSNQLVINMAIMNKDFKRELMLGTLNKRCYAAMKVRGFVNIDTFEFKPEGKDKYSVFFNVGDQRMIDIGTYAVWGKGSLKVVMPDGVSLPFPFSFDDDDKWLPQPKPTYHQLLDALKKAQEDINWMLNNRQFLNAESFNYIDEVLDKHES